MSAPFEEWFWSKVDRSGWPDACWVWLACTSRGYGCFGVGLKIRRAHRIAYEVCIGPVPVGFDLDHLCRNRACVNPAHLEPVTRRENTSRGVPFGGFGQHNRRKTACRNGHQYTADSVINRGDGRRTCKACHRDNQRRYVAKRQKESGNVQS